MKLIDSRYLSTDTNDGRMSSSLPKDQYGRSKLVTLEVPSVLASPSLLHFLYAGQPGTWHLSIAIHGTTAKAPISPQLLTCGLSAA